MHSFKVGDKVRRTTSVSPETMERTGVRKGCVYTVRDVRGASICLAESSVPQFGFDADAFALESPGATSWDVNEALRLRGLAVQAIQEYNAYLPQQPLLEAIEPPPPIK
ncbi:hypothetical protein NNAG4_orf013 [Klebsiella phage NNA-G4]|nr:hypothetical protein NNAG4_orf013 [Klebsiella phage NNA-G4]